LIFTGKSKKIDEVKYLKLMNQKYHSRKNANRIRILEIQKNSNKDKFYLPKTR